MARFTHVCTCAILLSVPLSAGEPADTTGTLATADSLARSYAIPEVVVTATRGTMPAADSPSPVSVLSGPSLALRPGSLAADQMIGLPGVAVRSYGGPGAVQTLSLRGMSPEHTLVLVDGMRVMNPQNGQADLSLFPVSSVSRVEIARGGLSGLYGADAAGGVVQFLTYTPVSGFEGRVDVGGGSAGFRSLDIMVGGAGSPFVWGVSGHREYGRGDYAFDFSDGQTTTRLKRSGADYGLTAFDASLKWNGPDGVRTSASLLLRESDRGSPGPVTDPGVRGTARLGDAVRHVSLRGEVPMGSALRMSLGASHVRSRQVYTDPGLLVGSAPLRSESTSESFRVSPFVDYFPCPWLTFQAGGDFARSSVSGSELQGTRREEYALFLSASVKEKISRNVLYDVLLFPSVRFDRVGGVGDAVSPRLGLNIGLLQSPLVRLRASAGRSFRVPSFNDLYWVAGGKPDLRPERATAYDAGVVALLPVAGELALDLGVYSITSHDRIVWTPGPGGLWSPRNVGRVSSRGVELDAGWTVLSGSLHFGVQSTLSEAVNRSSAAPGDATVGKQLVYVPLQTVRLETELFVGGVSAYASYVWVSHRYTTETNDRFLPSYGIASASVLWESGGVPVRFHLKAEVTNLFDVSYEVIALYPMPLRSIRIHAGVSF